jgi:hypothetical protein
MAGRTSKKSAKVAKKADAKASHPATSARRGPRRRVVAKAVKPRKAIAKSSARKPTKGTTSPPRESSRTSDAASAMIDQRIGELGDWRGSVLKRMRALIHEADPEVVEEWKWRKASSPGTPVWSDAGGICTGESYKAVVKLTFFHGASLKDPGHLFNSSLEGNTRRAIDIRIDDVIDEAAFKELIRAAVAFNVAKRKK